MINATNAVDGTLPTITLNVTYTGPTGVTMPIVTEIGARESVQLYVTGSVNITAISNANTTLEISITATGGGHVSIPPQRHTAAAGAVAFVPLSPNNGYAPPGRRWWSVYSDGPNFDLQILNSAGVVVFGSAPIPGTTVVGPFPLPPGTRLTGKGSVAAVNLTTVWTQTRGH